MIGVDCKYYMVFDYTAVKKLVNSLNGVDYDLPVTLLSDSVNLEQGKQNFNGDKAVQFLSFKSPKDNKYTDKLITFYDGSDYSRTLLLQSLFRELFKQKIKTQYITGAENIFKDISKNITTNITSADIANLVKNAKNINVQNVKTYILSGDDQKNSP